MRLRPEDDFALVSSSECVAMFHTNVAGLLVQVHSTLVKYCFRTLGRCGCMVRKSIGRQSSIHSRVKSMQSSLDAQENFRQQSE